MTGKWVKISLFNLLLVSMLGIVLRYKIAFALLFIEQKFLLHGHSHFAFAGWISQCLMALMVDTLPADHQRKYRLVLWANLLTAYGMLLSFPVQGYGVVSILFSTLSILVSYVFAFLFWKDTGGSGNTSPAQKCFRAALLWSVLSSLGTYSLVQMMLTHTFHEKWYLASIYFYLHFQYNGWFLFGCLGLVFHLLQQKQISTARMNTIFWCFALACLPAYFFSALWLPIPTVVYIIVVLAAIVQLLGWIILLRLLKGNQFLFIEAAKPVKWALGLSAIAFTIKLLLQAGSTIPSLSTIAFGFRPVVIGYLHLVLLGVLSLFLIGYSLRAKFIPLTRTVKTGLLIFSAAIILNELLLMVQGAAAMDYITVPYIDVALFLVACLLCGGILLMNRYSYIKRATD